MSSQLSTVPVRSFNARQAETVERLLEAALEELRAVGHDALSVRSVAARAAVAPATAYTYFASKNHLVAEVFARKLAELPHLDDAGSTPKARLAAEFDHLARFLADEPELAHGTTVAMLGPEPDVVRLRLSTGKVVADRLGAALGDAAPATVEALSLVWSGSLLQTGLGHQTYDEMAAQLKRVSALLTWAR